MTGSVSGGASALHLSLAIIFRHAAKSALIDFAFFGSRKRNAPML